MGTDTVTCTELHTYIHPTMNALISLVPCLFIVSVTASTAEEFKMMLESFRKKTMDGVKFTDLSLPAYMKPDTLNITQGIMNIIHMDPKSAKYFGEKQPVKYIKFSSNGAITVHFMQGQQKELMAGNSLTTRSGGLEGIDGDILEQIFPAEFIENFEASQALVANTSNSTSAQEGSGRIVNKANAGVSFVSPGVFVIGFLVTVMIFTGNLLMCKDRFIFTHKL